MNHKLPEVLESGSAETATMSGRGVITSTDSLAAECDNRLNQSPIFLFDDAFLGARRDKSFDVLVLSGWLLGLFAGLAELRKRLQETEKRRQRPDSIDSARVIGISATNQCPLVRR